MHYQIYQPGTPYLSSGLKTLVKIGSENSLDNVVYFVFCSPQLILHFTEGVQWFYYYRVNYTFPRIKRGPTFFRGRGGMSNFFQGGPNANFYRTPYNLLFTRGWGVQTPYPTPLDPHILVASILTFLNTVNNNMQQKSLVFSDAVFFILFPKAPIRTAADDKFCDIFPNFRKKIRYDIS